MWVTLSILIERKIEILMMKIQFEKNDNIWDTWNFSGMISLLVFSIEHF